MTSAVQAQKPGLVFFHSGISRHCRRVEGVLAQVLQRRRKHGTLTLYRVDREPRPTQGIRSQEPSVIGRASPPARVRGGVVGGGVRGGGGGGGANRGGGGRGGADPPAGGPAGGGGGGAGGGGGGGAAARRGEDAGAASV